MGRKLTYEELKQRVKKLGKELAELKRDEETLRTSEEWWRSLAKDSPNLILVVDRKGTIQFINHTVSGIKSKDVIGKNHCDYTPPKYHKVMRKSVEQVFKTGKPASYEIEGVGPNGTISWYASQLGPAKCGGKIVAVSIMPIDITERKRAEKHLRESEEKYKTLIDSSLTGIFIHQGGKYVFVNDRFTQMHGYTPEELKGKEYLALVHPDERKASRRIVSERLKGGPAPQQYEVRRRRKDGGTIWCEMMATRIEYKGRPAIMGNIIDITERKQAEEALRESENKYRRLLEHLPQRIFHKDKKSVYVSCNENYARDLNLKPEEIKGKTDYEFFPKKLARKYRSDDKKVITFGKTKDIEEKFIRDGKEIWVQTVKTPIRDEKGNITGILGIFWDITKRKQTEEALREREAALKAKTGELREVNSALRVLLKQRAGDKTELEEKVLLNVKELVVPYVEKMKRTHLDTKQEAYLKVLESNLNDIISPFAHKLSLKYLSLTPSEIEIAHLIKDGKSTKDIAELLGLSNRTVESHRQNIRTKIGIKNRKANLRSHLLTA